MSTGKLESGLKGYYMCVDCGTAYPANSNLDLDRIAKCNGHIIDLCPWCRPDSQSWRNGRGE
jgi:hypothetical protein